MFILRFEAAGTHNYSQDVCTTVVYSASNCTHLRSLIEVHFVLRLLHPRRQAMLRLLCVRDRVCVRRCEALLATCSVLLAAPYQVLLRAGLDVRCVAPLPRGQVQPGRCGHLLHPVRTWDLQPQRGSGNGLHPALRPWVRVPSCARCVTWHVRINRRRSIFALVVVMA
jgi:hypothetical protein